VYVCIRAEDVLLEQAGNGVTQKTAWFMIHRIRLALQKGSIDRKLMEDVEADETYIGGEARNMHKDKRVKTLRTEGSFRKAVVIGMLERKGEVRTAVINRASGNEINLMIIDGKVEGNENIDHDPRFSLMRSAAIRLSFSKNSLICLPSRLTGSAVGISSSNFMYSVISYAL
jgi:hypothetical protein